MVTIITDMYWKLEWNVLRLHDNQLSYKLQLQNMFSSGATEKHFGKMFLVNGVYYHDAVIKRAGQIVQRFCSSELFRILVFRMFLRNFTFYRIINISTNTQYMSQPLARLQAGKEKVGLWNIRVQGDKLLVRSSECGVKFTWDKALGQVYVRLDPGE